MTKSEAGFIGLFLWPRRHDQAWRPILKSHVHRLQVAKRCNQQLRIKI